MGSTRANRFVRHLGARGWQAVVVTPRKGMYHRLNSESPQPDVPTVVRTPSLELSRIARTLAGVSSGSERAGELSPVEGGPLRRSLRAVVREFVYIPDAQIGWLPFALIAGLRAIKAGPVALAYTTSVPYTAHLVGLLLRRFAGLPWVAEFRDLWTDAQFGRARTALRRRLDHRIESAIVHRADAVLVTTDEARTLLSNRYPDVPEGRIWVVHNAYEKAVHPPPAPPGPEEPFVLVHAGTLLPGVQDPAPLLRAAAAVESERPGSIRIRVYGPERVWNEAVDVVGAPPELLELKGWVAASEIPKELAKASCVLILVPGSNFNHVYAGKVFEWLGSGLPALAVVDPDGAMAKLVKRSGRGVIVPSNDPALLETALRRLVSDHRSGRNVVDPKQDRVIDEFEIHAVAEKLVSVLERVGKLG